MFAGAALAVFLSAHQLAALNIAYNEGQKYGIPIYTQAIILTESSACLHKRGDDGKSWGCGQLQVATARTVCRCNFNSRILEKENGTNIRISAAFLSECFNKFYSEQYQDLYRAILCYNIGFPAAAKATNSQVKHSKYVARVLYWVRRLHEIRLDTR